MTDAGPARFRAFARAHRLAGLAAAMAVVALPALGGEAARAALRYERTAVAAGEWWRLLTCHLV
ncbi:MAG: hypothetical protein JSR54_14810, partial [Proteobacteria bacterium]|nr:hypothetical protein [Pseudomonadota bacterium]